MIGACDWQIMFFTCKENATLLFWKLSPPLQDKDSDQIFWGDLGDGEVASFTIMNLLMRSTATATPGIAGSILQRLWPSGAVLLAHFTPFNPDLLPKPALASHDQRMHPFCLGVASISVTINELPTY